MDFRVKNEYIEFSDVNGILSSDLKEIPHNSFWDTGEARELKIHRIHAYPAKFPAFITIKALDYARKKGITVNRVADIFCGCGTVAFEARRESLGFWGCDINPVATLIARAKSHTYNSSWLNRYWREITNAVKVVSPGNDFTSTTQERLLYWYSEEQILELSRLKNAILLIIPERSKYQDFFLCAFSNILKGVSRWLTKSIKPQIDPRKISTEVLPSFNLQVKQMIHAYEECKEHEKSEVVIVNSNFLSSSINDMGKVDMIITSPPYVTSYEYADLHQLSALWLGFAEDYRTLREGSIGSKGLGQYGFNFSREAKSLNETGTKIVFQLFGKNHKTARSVAKYYLDMQKVAEGCSKVLSPASLGVFVIGNTKYKDVILDNARHLAESLIRAGFSKVSMAKRRITKKILTPYRTSSGRFTRSNSEAHVYGEEFILIAER